MSYRILITRDIKKQIQDLPGNVKTVARKQIAGLAQNPRPSGSKELDGHPGHFRLWLGAKYRLVWQVVEEETLIEIEYVGPKAPELYKKLGLKRPNE